MWVVRLAHPKVNKFRIIAEGTREAVEKKASDQMEEWDTEFSETFPIAEAVSRGEKRWLNPKPMKQLFSSEHRLRQMAEQFTAQVQEELAALNSLLRYGILVTYSVKLPTPPTPEEEPPEPQRGAFRPHLNLTDYMIPQFRKRKHAEAAARFAGAHSEWERLASAIRARNSGRAESYNADVVKAEAQKADYLRGDPATVAAYCRLLLGASVYPYVVASLPEIGASPIADTKGFKFVQLSPNGPLAVLIERPDTFSRSFELDYVTENRTLVVDYELPPRDAIPSVKGYKYVAAQDRVIPVPAPRATTEETYDSVLYQVVLRTTYELFRWDEACALDSVVFNGWVSSVDNATGQRVHPCVLTVQVAKKEFLEIDFGEVDPKTCFRKLKGISGAKLAAMSPVRPILQISREDKRFVTARPVIDALDGSTNLAAMDWEDFEQLIRDIFEKEFSGEGGEVKITRASRDHGVDAVAFDPDPIRGGKIVIQAKRYTDTVSVSAVRDLYGTILNEGANKGILVTTADYGADAYEFAKGKPITLLSGSELLYLLQKHGRKARIDLAEARLVAAGEKKRTELRR